MVPVPGFVRLGGCAGPTLLLVKIRELRHIAGNLGLSRLAGRPPTAPPSPATIQTVSGVTI
jgi:hypothetical protein